MSDYEYDIAAKAAGEQPLSSSDDHLPGFVQCQHSERMLSLEKTYDLADITRFVNRLAIDRAKYGLVVEPKYDGVAIACVYENGSFVRAVTRGNGDKGDNVTRNVTALSFPRVIPDLVECPVAELRGEIYMTYPEFERINAERSAMGESLYANPRNLTSGTVKQLDPAVAAQRRLSIVFHGVSFATAVALNFIRQTDVYAWFKANAFPTHTLCLPTVADATALAQTISNFNVTRRSYNFPTDGAVVKINDCRYQRDLGNGNRAPKWAIAFKYEPERATTHLRDIALQVGRTGVITPVAELDPVELDGSTVSRATLHNADDIMRKDIRIGDTVIIEKAGEIIPQIVRVDTTQRPSHSIAFDFKAYAESKGLIVTRREGEVAWRVADMSSAAVTLRGLKHAVSKPCLDIDGMGEAVLQQLFDRQYINTPADIYDLTHEQLMSLDSFGEKSAANLLTAIADSRRVEAWRALHSLGIPHIGAQTAKDVMAVLSVADLFYDLSLERVAAVPGLGIVAANALVTYFADDANSAQARRLFNALAIIPAVQQPHNQVLAGKVVVITGTLPTLSRGDATALVERNGGRVSGSVSKNTSFVLVGEDAGSKLAKATSLNIPVLGEEDFLDMIKAHPAV